MSADIIEVDDDEDGNSVYLTMNSHCHAWFGIYTERTQDCNAYHLTPDDNGIKQVREIISGLESWIGQVKTTR